MKLNHIKKALKKAGEWVLILKTCYDQSWECNDHLYWHMYNIGSPTSPAMQDECNNILDCYSKLNRRRKYIMPEQTVAFAKEEERECASLPDFLRKLDD
jgi:hypothetical protein